MPRYDVTITVTQFHTQVIEAESALLAGRAALNALDGRDPEKLDLAVAVERGVQ